MNRSTSEPALIADQLRRAFEGAQRLVSSVTGNRNP
jgi:hypothetical protein